MSQHAVVCQEWEESERGWGVRPDGASLHLTEADRKVFVEDALKRQRERLGEEVPDEYSRPSGDGFLLDVDEELYSRLVGKQGIWVFQDEYRKIRKRG